MVPVTNNDSFSWILNYVGESKSVKVFLTLILDYLAAAIILYKYTYVFLVNSVVFLNNLYKQFFISILSSYI